MQLLELWERLQAFFERGGDVLFVIFAVTAIMWAIIFERFWYMRFGHPHEAKTFLAQWWGRRERSSWNAKKIQGMLVARLDASLREGLPMVQTLVALCPLLGLLGTVTGMIEVFDVMAVAGNGNPRAMASGVSRATIPTMAGMVAALSGLYFSARLSRLADEKSARFAEALSQD